MRPSTFYKVVSVVLVALMIAAGALGAVLIHHTRQEADNFRKEKDRLAGELEIATQKLKGQQEFLDRLQNDPELIDRIARVQGYAKPDEIIFRFDTDPVTAAPPNGNDTLIHNTPTATADIKKAPASTPAKPSKPSTTAKTNRP